MTRETGKRRDMEERGEQKKLEGRQDGMSFTRDSWSQLHLKPNDKIWEKITNSFKVTYIDLEFEQKSFGLLLIHG